MAENEKQVKTQAEPEKAKKKAEKNAKPGIFARASKWFKDMKAELKKVVWPTRKQTINNTLIVLACVVVVAIFIGLFDFIATNAIELITTLL